MLRSVMSGLVLSDVNTNHLVYQGKESASVFIRVRNQLVCLWIILSFPDFRDFLINYSIYKVTLLKIFFSNLYLYAN